MNFEAPKVSGALVVSTVSEKVVPLAVTAGIGPTNEYDPPSLACAFGISNHEFVASGIGWAL